MATRATNISGNIANMTDTSSKAYQDAQKALSAYNTRGMSQKESYFKSIETFLSSRPNDSLTNYFTDLASAQKLTKESFSDLGLDASSFGVDNLSTVIDYFNNLADAADDAASSVKNVDGTFSGISEAFQTENAGDAYEDTGNYLQKAKEMFDKGLTNTDDVKSIGKMIGADPDDIEGTFSAKYEQALKYFTFDDAGNLTESGVETFMDEYRGKLESINGSFKTTQVAAQAMNMTAEEFEILMGRAQDHGLDFGDMVKSSEQLESAKITLEGLKEIYKEQEAPEGMDAQLEKWEDALNNSGLTYLDPTITAKSSLHMISKHYSNLSMVQKLLLKMAGIQSIGLLY